MRTSGFMSIRVWTGLPPSRPASICSLAEPRIRRLNDANALVCAILSTEGFSTGKASWLMVHPSGKKEAYLGPDIHIPIPALKRIGGVPDEQPRQ